MTIAMFVFLLVWIAVCTSTPAKPRWIESVRIADEDGRTFEQRLKDYGKRECLTCGRVIEESAYSGKDGNFRKHVESHKARKP